MEVRRRRVGLALVLTRVVAVGRREEGNHGTFPTATLAVAYGTVCRIELRGQVGVIGSLLATRQLKRLPGAHAIEHLRALNGIEPRRLLRAEALCVMLLGKDLDGVSPSLRDASRRGEGRDGQCRHQHEPESRRMPAVLQSARSFGPDEECHALLISIAPVDRKI